MTSGRSAGETVRVELSGEESDLLIHGLDECGGPAFATEELAIAMGFDGLMDFEKADPAAQGSPVV